jgi:hypothetical protein
LNTPDPKNNHRIYYGPLIIYCVYVAISMYWGLRLMNVTAMSLANPNITDGSLFIALSVLNLLVFILISILAFKTFDGKVGGCLCIFFTVIATVGVSWLDSTIPLPTF